MNRKQRGDLICIILVTMVPFIAFGIIYPQYTNNNQVVLYLSAITLFVLSSFFYVASVMPFRYAVKYGISNAVLCLSWGCALYTFEHPNIEIAGVRIVYLASILALIVFFCSINGKYRIIHELQSKLALEELNSKQLNKRIQELEAKLASDVVESEEHPNKSTWS